MAKRVKPDITFRDIVPKSHSHSGTYFNVHFVDCSLTKTSFEDCLLINVTLTGCHLNDVRWFGVFMMDVESTLCEFENSIWNNQRWVNTKTFCDVDHFKNETRIGSTVPRETADESWLQRERAKYEETASEARLAAADCDAAPENMSLSSSRPVQQPRPQYTRQTLILLRQRLKDGIYVKSASWKAQAILRKKSFPSWSRPSMSVRRFTNMFSHRLS